MEKITLSEAARQLNIPGMTVTRWLRDLAIADEVRNGGLMALDRQACITLALCRRLSEIKQLEFSDPGIWHLLKTILKGEHEEDLRDAIVAIYSGERRKVALTGADELVLRHYGTAGNGRVAWEVQGVVQHWSVDGVLSTFSLAPIYEIVDCLFAGLEQGKESEKTEVKV